MRLKQVVGLILGFVAAVCMIVYVMHGSHEGVGKKRVVILQIVEHPALDATVRGICDRLAAGGYRVGENLDLRIESAQGNAALASQIASKFAYKKPDVVIAVGTVAAQSFLPFVESAGIQLLFSSVTDPYGAGLLAPQGGATSAISGVSNFVPLAPQLELIRSLQPQLTRLGVLYNPGELNSVALVQLLHDEGARCGITIVEQTLLRTADAAQAATKLAAACEALFVSNDNTALAALSSIVMATRAARIPLYVSDTDAVSLGAVAALGPDQYQIGVQTGSCAIRILEGTAAGDIPLEYPAVTELVVNRDAAHHLSLTIPAAVEASAARIISAAH